MHRFGFKLFLKDKNTTEEYKKRHDEIWQEMIDVLDKAGIKNYSIWNSGKELFGYYECDDREYADRIQAESKIINEWNHYMEDLLVSEKNEEGKLVPIIEPMKLMFYKK